MIGASHFGGRDMRRAIGSLTDRIPAACPPLAVLFVLLLAPALARGQGVPTADDEWRITITPYVWTPSVSGSVATQSTQPSAEVDSSSLL